MIDPLAPSTSSNRGSNQNLVNARSRTQDRNLGMIFHFHCAREAASAGLQEHAADFCALHIWSDGNEICGDGWDVCNLCPMQAGLITAARHSF